MAWYIKLFLESLERVEKAKKAVAEEREWDDESR